MGETVLTCKFSPLISINIKPEIAALKIQQQSDNYWSVDFYNVGLILKVILIYISDALNRK